MRHTLIILVNVIALIITFIIYYRFSNTSILLTEEIVSVQERLSMLVYLMLFVTLPVIAITIYRFLKLELSKDGMSIIKSILIVFNHKKYVKIFITSLIIYGIFYSFITGLLIYRDDTFVNAPSFKIIPCCNLPGYMPILIISLTKHFGMLIIPLNLILLMVISTLVAINVTISIFIYNNRARGVNWLSGFGSIIGLFTGCPTCAGTFFLLFFGLSSSTLAILAPLQSLFIASSIPILLFTPILMIKKFNMCKL